MENTKQQLIKSMGLNKVEKGLYKGFYCDGGYYDNLKDYLFNAGFKTIFYDDWYYIKYIKEDENLLFYLIEGDLYLYDLNEYDTTLKAIDLKGFFEEVEEVEGFQNLNFEEIEYYLSLNESEKEILNFLISENWADSFQEAKEKIENVYIYEDWEEIIQHFIECSFCDVPENVLNYIDEDKIKRDLEIEGNYYEFNNKIYEYLY